VVLVDTNVLLDVVTADPVWTDWSQRQLETLELQTRLAINLVVYAELSIGFQRIDEVNAVLAVTDVEIEEIPRPALFLAGKAIRDYRARGGAKTGVLPAFFIGAHAVVARTALLTRDARRYRAYFPSITLITQADA
jgi:predicted nucleic acid-binding protein